MIFRRPVLIIAISVLSGSLFILKDSPIYAVFPFILIPFIFYRRRLRAAVIICLLTAAVFFGGMLSSQVRLTEFNRASSLINTKKQITLYGRILRKEKTSQGLNYTVLLRGSSGLKVQTTVDQNIPLGSKVVLSGHPQAAEPQRNAGCFDAESYYRSISVVSRIKDSSVDYSGESDFRLFRFFFQIMEALWCLKYMMQDVFTSVLPGEEGPLLASLCIGTKSLLDTEVKELFQNAGLSHVLAISGLHISIVGSVIFKLINATKLRKQTAAAVSFIIVFFYALTISDSVSCIRALIMYLIVMISYIFGDGGDMITSLSIVCIFLAVTDPLAFTQTAFVLSFAAVFMMAIIVIPASECYRAFCTLRWENLHKEIKGNRYKPTAKDDLVSSLISSFFIQIAMAGITARFFYNFPLLSCLLNVVILPFLPYMLCLGLLGGAVGILFPALSKVILFPCHLMLYWYEFSSGTYSSLPFSQIVTGELPVIKTVVCIVCVYVMAQLLNHQTIEMFYKRFTRIPWKKEKVTPVFGNLKVTGSVAAISVFLIMLLAMPSHHDEFAMLDVGQGDGMLMTTADGKAFMIDGGSTSVSDIGKNCIIPSLKYRGVSEVEGWFISHLDEDHVNGLYELIEKNYPIRNVYLASGIEKDEKYSDLLARCASKKIPVAFLNGGDTLQCGYFTLETLFPDAQSEFSGPNENSLVTVLTLDYKTDHPVKIIETGDIGEDQEKYLLNHHADDLRKNTFALILKSAHHGSNYSNCSEWLTSLNPDLILISAGKNNRYGHPGTDTMQRIKDLHLKSLCTIDTGQIRFMDGQINTLIQK